MIDNVISKKQWSLGKKICVKTIISLTIILTAVGLPQLAHLTMGAQSGIKYLPMYLPVIIGGAIMGTAWGLGIGILAPVVSFLITSAISNPMPALARLPFMIAELGVFALVTGTFSKLVYKKPWTAFIAVLTAEIIGRSVFIGLIAIFAKYTPFSVPMIWVQIKTGFIGLALQALIAPLVIIGIRYLIKKDAENA